MKAPTVCILGVGFVGLTLGISLSDAGANVLAWEKNSEISDQLAEGKTHISEPGLEHKLSLYSKNGQFRAISEFSEAVEATYFIVTVGTPLLNGGINLVSLNEAITQILPALKDDDLVIIRSTTAIGTCRDIVLPLLMSTGKKINLAMCPERTVEGKALEEMSSLPQIIGALDDQSFQSAEKFFQLIGPEIVRVSSLESAELAKLINNTYRDLMFGFANEIADISSAYKISAREVIEAANHNYSRSNISLPGISGGPCLEKDPWILAESGEKVGRKMLISKASRQMNEATIGNFLGMHVSQLLNIEKIAILGLSFKGKPQTKDLRGSAIFPVHSLLREHFPNANLVGFEPAGINSIDIADFSVENSVADAVIGADLVVVLTNSDSFSESSQLIAEYASKNCVILDFWSRQFVSTFLDTQSYISWAEGSR